MCLRIALDADLIQLTTQKSFLLSLSLCPAPHPTPLSPSPSLSAGEEQPKQDAHGLE